MFRFVLTIVCVSHLSEVVFGYATTATTARVAVNVATATAPSPFPSQEVVSSLDSGNPTRIPWLIVGGGIHGVHISARLIANGVINSEQDICIVDGHDSLLESWKCRTRNTGMKYLRSSAGYHLDLTEDSLRSFDQTDGKSHSDTAAVGVTKKQNGKKKSSRAKANHRSKDGHFSNDYERPTLDFFNEHCDSVITKYHLDEIHTKGLVRRIEPVDDHVRVHVSLADSGELVEYHANHIVLALGNDEPSYPDWVDDCDVENGFVKHLLDVNFDDESDSMQRNQHRENNRSVAIVGGGITAAHKALELSRKYLRDDNDHDPSTHLISRHPLKEQQFDTHQDWMMDRAASKRSATGGGYGLPKRQVTFQKCDCWQERRQIIAQERIPGTVTPAVNRGENGLKYAIENGDVGWHQSDVVGKEYVHTSGGTWEDERLQLELTLSCGEIVQVDQVLLATGFGKRVPGGALIQDLINQHELNVSEFCGYPIVDENLLWGERIHVAGALAELELGPSARNIAGARLAAERIVQQFI